MKTFMNVCLSLLVGLAIFGVPVVAVAGDDNAKPADDKFEIPKETPKKKGKDAPPPKVAPYVVRVNAEQTEMKEFPCLLYMSQHGLRWPGGLSNAEPINDEELKHILRNPGVARLRDPKFKAQESYPNNDHECVLVIRTDPKVGGPGPFTVAELATHLERLDRCRDRNRPTYVYLFINSKGE